MRLIWPEANGSVPARDYMNPASHLALEAAQARQKAIQAQLSLGFTLCAIARTEILYDRPSDARMAISKVQRIIESVRSHLAETNHVPSNAVSDLADHLARLEKRADEVQSDILAGKG